MINCYFCSKELSRYIAKDHSTNYDDHCCCYACPQAPSPYLGLDVWKQPCHIIVNDDDTIRVAYLYFNKLRVWLNVYYFGERAFTDIKDENNNVAVRVKVALDVFNMPQEVLENKIKNWILFS